MSSSSNEHRNHFDTNKESWNQRTAIHLKSSFYDVDGFLEGKSSLNTPEIDLLGDLKGKKVLHLQCHFGLDSLSMARMDAEITAVDISSEAIEAGSKLAEKAGIDARFIESNIYDLKEVLNEEFDVIFTSYGALPWLPDLNSWGDLITSLLAPGGQFIMVEFHPLCWMYDDDFTGITYSYFNDGPLQFKDLGSYTDGGEDVELDYVTWNHSIAEVLQSLLAKGLTLEQFEEYDYTPYDVFPALQEVEKGKFRFQELGAKWPFLYGLVARK